MSAERLYTPELLALAVELARHPPLAGDVSAKGEARSPTCGSTLAMDLSVDRAERIDRIGLKVHACAVGQAAASIFARHAAGRTAADIAATLGEIEAWLAQDGPLPHWPDFALIEAAGAYPGRHGAILLPWRAASAALSTEAPAS